MVVEQERLQQGIGNMHQPERKSAVCLVNRALPLRAWLCFWLAVLQTFQQSRAQTVTTCPGVSGTVQMYFCSDDASFDAHLNNGFTGAIKTRVVYCGEITTLPGWENQQSFTNGPTTPQVTTNFPGNGVGSFPLVQTQNYITYTSAAANTISTTLNTNGPITRKNDINGLALSNGLGPSIGFTFTTAYNGGAVDAGDATLTLPSACTTLPCTVQGGYDLPTSVDATDDTLFKLSSGTPNLEYQWGPFGNRNAFEIRADPAILIGAPPTFQALARCGDVATTEISAASANGDPHFLRWGQEHRDSFHGECDLVLVSSKETHINVYIRTKIRKFYSYIWKMAIGIDNIIIEVDKTNLAVGGTTVVHDEHNVTFPIVVHDTTTSRNITIIRSGEKEYKIQWGTTSSFKVSITGIFLNIDVEGAGSEFSDSTGLMGKFGSGEMLDRQGNLMDSNDINAYGMEWQVKPDQGDPMLFSKPEGPQWPDSQCIMPHWIDPKKNRRKLRGSNALLETAQLACAGAKDYDLCVDDVLVGGEISAANPYFVKR